MYDILILQHVDISNVHMIGWNIHTIQPEIPFSCLQYIKTQQLLPISTEVRYHKVVNLELLIWHASSKQQQTIYFHKYSSRELQSPITCSTVRPVMKP